MDSSKYQPILEQNQSRSHTWMKMKNNFTFQQNKDTIRNPSQQRIRFFRRPAFGIGQVRAQMEMLSKHLALLEGESAQGDSLTIR